MMATASKMKTTIVPVDPTVTVYDLSLTRNVIQTFLALRYFVT